MRYFGYLLAALGSDWLSKRWVRKYLPIGRKQRVGKSCLYLWHVKNKGIAYQKFSGRQGAILTVTGSMLALFLTQLFDCCKKGITGFRPLGLALFIGGGIGNFWERLTRREVTDFLYCKGGKHAPIFNLADLWILLGVILYTVSGFFCKE